MKEAFFAKLEELVAAAKSYRAQGFSGVDPEEATKQHLIEPLLESLGYTRDSFDKEFHILGGQVDYLLKHHRPLMFLEAKSLLDSAPDLFKEHKQQVLEYIRNYRYDPNVAKWDQPVNWIVLTNFAQIHFIRVTEESPSFSFTLNELQLRREDLWELLALERVEVNRIEELYDQQQKAELDKRFLADLKRWRLIIANGFALRNAGVSLPDLTKASQQLLDRFIFCRMLEAHGLIDYNRLARQFAHYEELYPPPPIISFAEFLRQPLFADIKAKFNTELFEQPLLCDQLAIDNEALAVVIGHQPLTPDIAGQCGIEYGQGELLPSFKHLYGYDFSRMSGDVMGSVYERFLAHKLSSQDGRIVIEDTDELRKKEGIYYTPRYIVDYIVAHTVGEKIKPVLDEALTLLLCKSYPAAHAKISELANIKVLDAAMGSGSFLLRAFDAFVQAYTAYNVACETERKNGGHRGDMLFDAPQEKPRPVDRLGLRVIANNIFGVDLDEQAVEVAKLNLWIRLMAAERESIRLKLSDPAKGVKPLNLLPTLANNIKCGDSLIDDAVVAGDTAFNWPEEFPEIMRRGGFDCVIGNPPYERIQTMMGNAPKVVEFLKANYQSAAAGNFDIYVCFIERGLHLLSPNGSFGYIVPHKFFQTDYGESLRKVLADGGYVRRIVSFGDLQVFPQVSTYTCLLFLDKAGCAECEYVKVDDLDTWRDSSVGPATSMPTANLSSAKWNFAVGDTAPLLKKLTDMPVKLKDIAERMSQGIRTSANEVFVLDLVSASGDIITAYSEQLQREVKLERKAVALFLQGREIKQYRVLPSGKVVILPYRIEKGSPRLFSEADLKKGFPKTYEYLSENKRLLESREEGKMRGAGWYGYVYPKNIEFMSQKKILVPDIADRASFAFDEKGDYAFTSGYGITLNDDARVSPLYLLGLLNSRLLDCYLKSVSTTMRGGFVRYFTQYIEQLPIKVINPKSKNEAALGKQVVHHVETIQEAHRQRLQLPRELTAEVLRSHRTDCSLGHYLQKDYAAAVTAEVLIDDVRRKGFVRGILVQSGKKHIIIAAEVSAAKNAAPVVQPVVRLTFTNPALQQFIYASWRSFLEANARKKTWTTGKTPQPIYDLVVNGLQSLAFFQPGAADNLRTIRDLMKSVAKEVGTSDLAAVEAEIAETDEAINQLVYELYGLTEDEKRIVEEKTGKA